MASAFPILLLPRELRDQIYLHTLLVLEGSKITRIGSLAGSSQNIWYPKRECLPGCYRPLKHYHRSSSYSTCSPDGPLRWDHESRIVQIPALFQVGGAVAKEARELYMSKFIMLEAKILEDFVPKLDQWAALMGEDILKFVQRLQVHVHVDITFTGDETDPKMVKLRNVGGYERDIVDPIFRVEVLRRGHKSELHIKSAIVLGDYLTTKFAAAIRRWAAKNRRAGEGFTGHDVVAAARTLINAIAKNEPLYTSLRGDMDISQVEDISEFPGDQQNRRLGYGTAITFKEVYPHLITKVTPSEQFTQDEQDEEDVAPRHADEGLSEHMRDL